ncbi:Rv0361 family membrane protein, partial [Mycobacteroides abscessus]
VASIDEVVVNGEHAEANVTSFMAFAPQTRSSRSFDLQFRDNQWKICQSD